MANSKNIAALLGSALIAITISEAVRCDMGTEPN